MILRCARTAIFFAGTSSCLAQLIGPALASSQARQEALARQESVLRAALNADPSAVEKRYALAYVLFLEQKPAESLAAYTQAAAQRTPTAKELETVALDYVLIDDYVDAEKWMTRSLEGQPESSEAWYDLGRIRYSRSRTSNAAEAFEHALRLDPHSVKAENNLGLALEAEGKITDAEAAYRQAILWQKNAEKQSEQPLLNLGILLVNLDRAGEALPVLLEAFRIAPQDARISEQLGRAYRRQGKFAEAQSALERAVALSPESASIHYLLGQVYAKEEKKDAAGAEFARVAALTKARSEPQPPGTQP